MGLDALITDELVSEALSKDKGKNAKLVSWSQESATKPESRNNSFNVIRRIKVRYSDKNVEKSTSYVSKINPCNPDDAFSSYRQRAALKEVFFYDTLVPLLNAELHKMGEGPLKVPKYLNSFTEEEREVIIFEDLELKRFETFEKNIPMDDSHSKVMATELSRFHAAALALQKNYSEDLGKVFPLLIESWHRPEINLRDSYEKVFQKGMFLNINLLKTLGRYKDLLPWMESLSERLMQTILKEMEANPPWRGICHGDYHRTNALFKYDHERNPIDIMVLDWQNVRISNIVSDIGYLVYSSYKHSIREKRFSLVVNSYVEKFRQIFGPETFFTPEELLKETDCNQYAILLSFYVIPLSLCVPDFPKLFKIDPDEIKKFKSEVADGKVKDYLKNIPYLSTVFIDYLEELKRKNLHVTH